MQNLIYEYQVVFYAVNGYESTACNLSVLSEQELKEAIQELNNLTE